MKIFYISTSIIPSRFANSIHVMKMCQAFAKGGHEVVLYACHSNNLEDEYGYYGVDRCFDIVKRKWPPVRGIGGFLYAHQVWKDILKKELPDLFYGRDPYSMSLLASTGCPLIYEAHTPPENRILEYLMARIFRYPNFCRLVVISEALKKEYMRIFHQLSSARILVAHDGADIPTDHKTEVFAKDWPGRSDRVQIGYVGHLYAGKGMEVIARLAQQMPNCDFHVIGGIEEDIERWKESCSETTNICFHGFVAHGMLQELYESFDITLAPYQRRVVGGGRKVDISRWMSPLKIFEYMAHGKAIVASDLPVLREVLIDRENSLLVEPEDIHGWIQAIRSLNDNAQFREMLGTNARNSLINLYSWSVRAEKIIERTFAEQKSMN